MMTTLPLEINPPGLHHALHCDQGAAVLADAVMLVQLGDFDLETSRVTTWPRWHFLYAGGDVSSRLLRRSRLFSSKGGKSLCRAEHSVPLRRALAVPR
jgi:hypothetical protein